MILVAPSPHAQPPLNPTQTVNHINTSQREIYDTFTGARTGGQLRGQGNWVHVSVDADVGGRWR